MKKQRKIDSQLGQDAVENDLDDVELAQRLDKFWAQPKPISASSQHNAFVSHFIGTTVGGYRIERMIGAGSFGLIFKAHDERLGRSAALKIPRHEVLADHERLLRFQVEAVSSASLDHPGIVPVFNADLESDPPYIASAFCPGPNLQQWIEEYGIPEKADDAAKLLLQIAFAVQHAHEHGVLHRDLKPSNVMLSASLEDDEQALSEYTARLTDFGLAQLMEVDLLQTKSSLVLGTPQYMAPEQAECRYEEVGPATDVFSLGTILYELLTGKTPFQASNYSSLLLRLREGSPDPISDHRVDVPSDLEVICKTCLHQNPDSRYPTAAALAEDLSRYLACEPIHARTPNVLQRLKQWSLRPSRMSDFCVTFMLISLFRLSFSALGLIAVNASDAVNPTFHENIDVILFLLLVTSPLDICLMFFAYRNQEGKLSQFTYFGVLAIICAIGIAMLGIAADFIDAPSWYNRMPAAKLMVFLLIGMLFGLQSACWYFSDWSRLQKRGQSYPTKPTKLAILLGTIVLFGCLTIGKAYIPNATKLAGPAHSILLDGKDDYVQVESASFTDGDQFTLEAWVEFAGNRDGTVLNYPPIVVILQPDGDRAFVKVTLMNKDESMILINSVDSIPLNQWSHIAVTYNGAAVKLFIDGKRSDTTVRELSVDNELGPRIDMPSKITLTAVYGVASVNVGITNEFVRTPFHGRIGEVRVSNNSRYVDHFQPSNDLVKDSTTKFLLKFEDGGREISVDNSQPYHVQLYR